MTLPVMTMMTTTMMTTMMMILMTMTESSFSFSLVVTHQQRIIIERRQPYNFGTSTTTTTTTSLRGIDYDAIGNNSNNNNENSDEYCDFDTPGRIPTPTPNDISNENCIELPMPNTDWTPVQVVQTCMNYLQTNNEPHTDSGLEVCYNFSSDSCRMANGGSLESFLVKANNPVFQTLVNCQSYQILNIGPEIQGTQTRGTMQTVLINVIPKTVLYPPKLNSWGEVIITKDIDDNEANRNNNNNNERRFLWTLMKERRPPRQGYFLVHECIACDNAYALH